MANQPRFVTDEHVSPSVAAALRREGLDIVTFQEAGRRGLTDATQLAWALAEGRVVVTFDDDYLALAAGGEHAGIAFCHERKYTVSGVIEAIRRVWRAESAETMRSAVKFL